MPRERCKYPSSRLPNVSGAKLRMKFAHCSSIGPFACCPGCHAQWQWIDKDNKKVFSDQAPPSEIPDKNILRRPGATPAANLGRRRQRPTRRHPAATPRPPLARPRKRRQGRRRRQGTPEEKTRKAEEAEKAEAGRRGRRNRPGQVRKLQPRAKGKATWTSGMRVARVNEPGRARNHGRRATGRRAAAASSGDRVRLQVDAFA